MAKTPRAILIIGSEKRHKKHITLLAQELEKEVNVTIINSQQSQFALTDITKKLKKALKTKTRQPLLIVYNGHGRKSGWAIKDSIGVRYTRLIKLIRLAQRPVFIINDCCHAFSLADKLARYRWPIPIGLLAASATNETSSSMIPYMLPFLNNGLYNIADRPRWGEKLDHHFFAVPKMASAEVSNFL